MVDHRATFTSNIRPHIEKKQPVYLKKSYCDNILVLKTVNRKPVCQPKDSDPVTFRFLQTKTGFITYVIILP